MELEMMMSLFVFFCGVAVVECTSTGIVVDVGVVFTVGAVVVIHFQSTGCI